MWSSRTREEVNKCLRHVIIAARESQGMDIQSAARLVGLTETEFVIVEKSPALICNRLLYEVMKTLGRTNELAEVIDRMTIIELKDNIRHKRELDLNLLRIDFTTDRLPIPLR